MKKPAVGRLVQLNFLAGTGALAASNVIWVLSGLEVTSAVGIWYAVAIGLLLVSLGLWAYRKYAMTRAWAVTAERTVSNNAVRRQRRGRRQRRPAFIEPLAVNQGIRVNRPDLVAQIETCEHPDFVQAGPVNWNCVSCSLTVIGNSKPDPGRREIV